MDVTNGFEFALLALIGAALAGALVGLPRRTPDDRPEPPDGKIAAEVADDLPFPLWRLDQAGRLIWKNAAFRDLARRDPQGEAALLAAKGRICLEDGRADGGSRDTWFETGMTAGRGVAGATGHALPADDLVRAERHLREMVHAMAKTFAHLPTGLAVFDASRHLQSFNPALAELTGLPPQFLSRRPSLLAILDAMRDRRMVPEPPDWKGWRRQVADMERAAADGLFEDVWPLPGGQTYRITGRLHPDGGLALMIDDISSETLRSRRYRASLELCQNVIDSLEEGIAVFAGTGQLVMANDAYAAIWGHDPGTELAPVGLPQMAAHWRGHSAPTTLWAEVEEFHLLAEDRFPWTGQARLSDGRLLACRFVPLADGAMLAGFSIARGDGMAHGMGDLRASGPA